MVKVKAFGKENMDALPDSLIGGLLIFKNVIDLIKCLHFDDDFPENHNVKLQEDACEVFGGRKWKKTTKKHACNMLIKQACDILKTYCDNNKEKILEEDINEYELEDILEELDILEKCGDQDIVLDLHQSIRELLEK